MITLRVPFVFPTRIEWLALLIMIGIFGFLAQVLLTMGLQRETAGRGTMAIYVQIIFASILERVFFHVVPSALSLTGTVIIMGSAIFVALTKESGKHPRNGNNQGATSADGSLANDVELESGLRLLRHDYLMDAEVRKGSLISLDGASTLSVMDARHEHLTTGNTDHLDHIDDSGDKPLPPSRLSP